MKKIGIFLTLILTSCGIKQVNNNLFLYDEDTITFIKDKSNISLIIVNNNTYNLFILSSDNEIYILAIKPISLDYSLLNNIYL